MTFEWLCSECTECTECTLGAALTVRLFELALSCGTSSFLSSPSSNTDRCDDDAEDDDDALKKTDDVEVVGTLLAELLLADIDADDGGTPGGAGAK